MLLLVRALFDESYLERDMGGPKGLSLAGSFMFSVQEGNENSMLAKPPFENYFTRRKEDYLEYLKSERWQELKKKKLAQTGYKCQRCGSPYRLQVHHKRYGNLYSENLWDLHVLCDECHSETHLDLAEEKQRRYEEKVWKSQQEWENNFLNKVLFNIFLIFSIPFVAVLELRNSQNLQNDVKWQ